MIYTSRVREVGMVERMLTVNEVASMARVGPETVRRWLRGGDLRGVRIGPGRGSYRIPESEVERMLQLPEPEREAAGEEAQP